MISCQRHVSAVFSPQTADMKKMFISIYNVILSVQHRKLICRGAIPKRKDLLKAGKQIRFSWPHTSLTVTLVQRCLNNSYSSTEKEYHCEALGQNKIKQDKDKHIYLADILIEKKFKNLFQQKPQTPHDTILALKKHIVFYLHDEEPSSRHCLVHLPHICSVGPNTASHHKLNQKLLWERWHTLP